jgi:AraC-like DNA-binding protein
MFMLQEAELVEQLSCLKVYRDFEQAFYQVTELSVRLRTLGMWNLACALLHEEGRFYSIAIVPVWLGENIIGVLQTDRAALEEPMSRQLVDGEKPVTNAAVVENSNRPINGPVPVFSRSRYEAMVHLLQIFAEQLSFYANQIVIRLDQGEPYRVRVARTFISNHRGDDIDLADVARATHVSTFYFCKIFKKATGLTFVEYRNRLRIESAKKMLLNPNLSVSEVAYSVGFQSLTQFNRLFRRVVGKAPTHFRSHLAPETAPSKKPHTRVQPSLPSIFQNNSIQAKAIAVESLACSIALAPVRNSSPRSSS